MDIKTDIKKIRELLNKKYGGLRDATDQQIGKLWATEKKIEQKQKESKKNDNSKQTGNDV